jgi:salicylate hydroxylase
MLGRSLFLQSNLSMANRIKVLVSGAGIGGLTAALALLKKGFDVDVFEQAPSLSEVGAGVQIGPNGTRLLFALGLEEQVRSFSAEPGRKEIRIWDSGERQQFVAVGADAVARYGAPYLTMHRADLHNCLIEAIRALAPDCIHLGHRTVQIEQDETSVTLCFENGHQATGEILVGADGLHSAVRKALFGPAQAKFTGGVAWRGLIAANKVQSVSSRTIGTTWIGPRGHVVTYPVRRGELVNFVGHVERDDWQVEGWTERGEKAECQLDFRGWHPEVQELIENIETPFKWALFLRGTLDQWGVGRTTLLGDACHATLPYLAQGANMAIEDGVVLARCLEQFGPDWQMALQKYEQARIDRTSRIVRGSADNLGRFHNAALADPKAAKEHMAKTWNKDNVAQNYDWIYAYDATTTPL